MDGKKSVLFFGGYIRPKNTFFRTFGKKIRDDWSDFNPFKLKIQTKVSWFLNLFVQGDYKTHPSDSQDMAYNLLKQTTKLLK